MRKKDNILLIGFMGCGKGSVARELSKILNKFALDGDDLLESLTNKKIKDIFSEDGEKTFRALEEKLAKFIKKDVTNVIISTGGGFYKVKNIDELGIKIYLKGDFDYILERLNSSPNAKKKIEKRPLLKDLDKARELFKQREKDYEKIADFTIDITGKSETQIAKEIKKLLNKVKK